MHVYAAEHQEARQLHAQHINGRSGANIQRSLVNRNTAAGRRRALLHLQRAAGNSSVSSMLGQHQRVPEKRAVSGGQTRDVDQDAMQTGIGSDPSSVRAQRARLDAQWHCGADIGVTWRPAALMTRPIMPFSPRVPFVPKIGNTAFVRAVQRCCGGGCDERRPTEEGTPLANAHVAAIQREEKKASLSARPYTDLPAELQRVLAETYRRRPKFYRESYPVHRIWHEMRERRSTLTKIYERMVAIGLWQYVNSIASVKCELGDG